jgi:integrase
MAAARAAADPRDRLVMELLARTGMRAGELADLEADAVVRIGEAYWLRIPLGKLRNDRYVPLHPQLVTLLAARTAANPGPHAPATASPPITAAPSTSIPGRVIQLRSGFLRGSAYGRDLGRCPAGHWRTSTGPVRRAAGALQAIPRLRMQKTRYCLDPAHGLRRGSFTQTH